MADILSAIVRDLPTPDFAFGYGSGVFEQTGYAKDAEPPMVDLILATADASAWHSLNLSRHRSHYSSLGHLGGSVLARIQEDYGAGLYYNTLVPIPGAARGRKMKYGVISTHTLIDDLLNWSSLYVAGRMHKPVHVICNSNRDVTAAIQENLRHAVRAALLMLPISFSANQFYMTIAGLSYLGDFRMVFGENPAKVANIVNAGLPGFHALYLPVLEAAFPNVTAVVDDVDSSNAAPRSFRQDVSPEVRLAMGLSLPYRLQRLMAAAWASETSASTHATLLTAAPKPVDLATGAQHLAGSSGRASQLVQRLRTLSRRLGVARGVALSSPSSNTAVKPNAVPSSSVGRMAAAVQEAMLRRAHVQQQRKLIRTSVLYGDAAANSESSPPFAPLVRRRALAFAQAGFEMMQRARMQRLQWRVAKQQQHPVASAALAHAGSASGGGSDFSQLSFQRASADRGVIAFWEAVLAQSDPSAVAAAGGGSGDHLAAAAFAASASAGLGFSHLYSSALDDARRTSTGTATPRRRAADVAVDVRRYLRPAIAHIVGSSARMQSLKGIATAGPVASAVYLAAKLRKYFQAVLPRLRL